MHPIFAAADFRARLCVVLLFLCCGATPRAEAQDDGVTRWWRAREVTGNLAGLCGIAWDRGIIMEGRWRAIYFGILSSEDGSGNAFPHELAFDLWLDLANFSKLAALDGLAAFGEVRWREPGAAANPNHLADGYSLFNPSRYSGGLGWRLMSFGFSYERNGFFGREDALVLHAGWIQPQKEFIKQPPAQLFANNALGSSEGLGGNIPFGSSFPTWARRSRRRRLIGFMRRRGFSCPIPTRRIPRTTDSCSAGIRKRATDSFSSAKRASLRCSGPTSFRVITLSADVFTARTTRNSAATNPASTGRRTRCFGAKTASRVCACSASVASRRSISTNSLSTCRAVWSTRARSRPATTTNSWRVQPFAQYIVQPDGTSAVANAATLGLFFGVDF